MPAASLRRWLILTLLGALALTGTAVAQDTFGLPPKPEIPDHVEKEPPKDIAEAGAETVTTTVQARDEWTSSGVRVRKGVKYRVSASGEWHMGGFCGRSGPSGTGSNSPLCFSFIPPFILPQHQVGTLIGKIDKDGRPFPVGELLEFEADRDGTLFLRSNDPKGLTQDNSGYVTARVALVAPPAPPAPPPAAAPPASARQNGPAPAPPQPFAGSTQHWAVVIGVSDYADSRIPKLRYAANDAQALHDWLVSPQGGRYAPSRVKLLLNRNATAAAIKEALYTWLRQAIEEDIVVIYFAGHGSPDSPDTPQNLYLLPHDTRYDAIASTGFPMWDVETALKRFIKAKRVVVLADACHSGGVGATFDMARRALGDVQPNRISTGLQNLATVGEGIAVISASDDRQLSAESAKFGGGHGVFTHYLLEGLKGQADYNKDSRVTLGELIPFLSEHVRRETLNAQSPTVAGRFDPALSLGR
ncbi:MAG: caspase family protein [Rhodocyclales bacterium]|nr:caspase family protein [Rhodocyclales bacterium]